MNFLKNITAFFIDKKPRLTIFLALLLFLTYFYSPVLFHPGSYLVGDKGDAVKNYFSYEWHVRNDSSLVNYTGTNYPFGEQHIYTDGNPLLSNVVSVLPFLKNYSISIFNLSLLFSIVITALLLFNIFREFKVANGFAIIASFGIAVLSPQTIRMSGHFTLSYSFFIPLVIWLLILYETRVEKAKYSVLTALVLLGSFFVHPYMGMILTSMVFLYHVITATVRSFSSFSPPRGETFASAKERGQGRDGQVRRGLRLILPFLLQSVLPITIYFLYLKLTDTHANRTSHPYGFLFFIARIESVFVSSLPPFRHMLSQIIKVHEQNWEGLAYVGISSLFTIICLPFLLYRKRQRLRAFISENKDVSVFLIISISSVFLLIFSMGYPFKWGMESLLDQMPFVRQFRSPGRFAWVFYFTATIGAAILLSKYFLTGINSYIRGLLVSAILLLFAVEGFPFHKQVAAGISRNCFELTAESEMKQICDAMNRVKPQAIIPLPFFHVGTDYFSINGTEKIKTASFIAALNTKTPILASCTDRTSLDEAKASIQLIGSNLIRKDLESFISNKRPFCILYSKEMLEEGEGVLLAKGRMLIETTNYIVKELTPQELFADEIGKSRNYFAENKSKLKIENGFLVSDSSYLIKMDFDDLPGQHFEGKIENVGILLDIPQNTLEKDKTYEMSFWYDLRNEDELTNEIVATEITEKGDSIRVLAEKKCSSMSNALGKKLLVVLNFKTADPQNKIRIYLKGNKEYKGTFSLDNLLIRRKDVFVYKMIYSAERKDSVLTLNNFELR